MLKAAKNGLNRTTADGFFFAAFTKLGLLARQISSLGLFLRPFVTGSSTVRWSSVRDECKFNERINTAVNLGIFLRTVWRRWECPSVRPHQRGRSSTHVGSQGVHLGAKIKHSYSGNRFDQVGSKVVDNTYLARSGHNEFSIPFDSLCHRCQILLTPPNTTTLTGSRSISFYSSVLILLSLRLKDSLSRNGIRTRVRGQRSD